MAPSSWSWTFQLVGEGPVKAFPERSANTRVPQLIAGMSDAGTILSVRTGLGAPHLAAVATGASVFPRCDGRKTVVETSEEAAW